MPKHSRSELREKPLAILLTRYNFRQSIRALIRLGNSSNPRVGSFAFNDMEALAPGVNVHPKFAATRATGHKPRILCAYDANTPLYSAGPGSPLRTDVSFTVHSHHIPPVANPQPYTTPCEGDWDAFTAFTEANPRGVSGILAVHPKLGGAALSMYCRSDYAAYDPSRLAALTPYTPQDELSATLARAGVNTATVVYENTWSAPSLRSGLHTLPQLFI